LLFLFALGLTESMSLICHEAVDMSEQEVKDRTEQISPYRTGQNLHLHLRGCPGIRLGVIDVAVDADDLFKRK
jgi:hypothetical protein